MKKLLNNILKNDFRRNILTMMSGVVSAKIIPFIVLPILYRIFQEEDFGHLYLFSSLVTLLAGASTLSYEFSIVLERKLVKAFQLTTGVFMILFLFCLMTGLVLFLFYDQIVAATSLKEIDEYIWLIPFAVFVFGGMNILNYWLNRASAFRWISMGRVVNSSTAETVKVVGGSTHWYSGGLIYGFLVGKLMIFLFYWVHFITVSKKIVSKFSWSALKKLFIKHKKFPRFSLPSSIITNLINFLYISLFLEYYGSDVAGNVGLSSTYIFGVFSMVSVAYSQVFYNEIAPIQDKIKLKKFYWKNASVLSVLGGLSVVVIYLLPIDFYVWLLGSKAVNLAPVLEVMIVWMALSFVTSSLSFIYAKINAQDKMFYLDVLKLILVPGSIYLSYHFNWNESHALWMFTGAQFFHYAMALLLVNYFIRMWNPYKAKE